ncbi:MAG: acetoacetate decarboxylase family protein [Thermomicrobiales bacterium]|nr:acetoacetate decarboxylase family protein [Thermomicrobiales bacterium]
MFTFSETRNYTMPPFFGSFGAEGQPPGAIVYNDTRSISIGYETDPDMLAALVPAPFEVVEPVVKVEYGMMRGVEWMSGGGYNLVQVIVPVVYTHGDERLEGPFNLVVWENSTEPILGGRERTGIPKLFANITDHHTLGDRLFTNVSYEGRTFLSMEFRKSQQLLSDADAVRNPQPATINAFGWRYIPNIGKPGAALSHATLYPQQAIVTEVWAGEGSVEWTVLTQEQHPLQAHIIAGVAALPNKGYRTCTYSRARVVLHEETARALE